MKPASLKKLIASINALPGITKKQSEKLAYNLLTTHKPVAEAFVETFNQTKKIITTCKECGHLADDKLCQICTSLPGTRRNILVIVESPLDVFRFEEVATIKGYYHVLNGLINETSNNTQHLNVKNLAVRSQKFSEVILALSSNLEGLLTANYIKTIVNHKKITQLAQGIPLGAAMEYVDKLTLHEALKNRREPK